MVSDKTRRSAFIEQNLGLVHSCAGRFRGRGIEYDDLYSAGCMGLVKAYDGFDESRGVCFSTYAVPVIVLDAPAPEPPGAGMHQPQILLDECTPPGLVRYHCNALFSFIM